jgi:hypothetical protein
MDRRRERRVSLMPPSPYQAPSTSIAGKKNGSAADAIT